MKIVEPGYEILNFPREPLRDIELAGRTCYKSENAITEGSAERFVKMIIDRGHESVIEHASASVKFIVDRGVSHELVRHRLCAFSQESTRYCNYDKDRFGGELTFIKEPFWDTGDDRYLVWCAVMKHVEDAYHMLIAAGAKPEEARSVLPNSLKTEVVVTTNFREWRHVFRLRTSKRAHPQMRQVMEPLLKDFQGRCPVVFDDL